MYSNLIPPHNNPVRVVASSPPPRHFCRQGNGGTGTLSCWPRALEQGVAALDFEPATCARGPEPFGFYLPRKFFHVNQLEPSEYKVILVKTPASHLQLLKTSWLTWALDVGLSVMEPQERRPGSQSHHFPLLSRGPGTSLQVTLQK